MVISGFAIAVLLAYYALTSAAGAHGRPVHD
jgi:hypothetical protein